MDRNINNFVKDRRIRTVEGWALYAVFCAPFRGQTFVKIGVSTAVQKRLISLSTGCPFEFDTVKYMLVGRSRIAFDMERMIHEDLSAYNTAKEWFCFDVSDPVTKKAFNESIARGIEKHFDRVRPFWQEISRADHRKFIREHNEKSR